MWHPVAGTYYVQVSGDPGAQFNLVVTRNADFNTNPNNSIATAQPFNGNGAVLGAITKELAPIYTLDDNLTNPPFPIWNTNPRTARLSRRRFQPRQPPRTTRLA